MKWNIILPVLAAGATACPNAELPDHHGINALLGRDINPSTMDPVRLSVLEVLRTAMPTNGALPTGTVEPDWYKNLPQDVKNLLPSLYPVTAKAAAATPTSSVVGYATPSSSKAVSSSAAPSATTSSVLSTSKASSSMYIPSYTPTAVISNSSSVATSSSVAAATSRPANVTTPTGSGYSASAVPSRTFSTGSKTAIRMETLTALMWLGVGAGFMIFA